MSKKKNIEGSVVLITGASSGIGLASAEAFARAGATPVLAARRRATLQRALDNILPSSPEASFVTVDVSDPDEVERAVRQVLDRYGRIDVLFNNAGHASVGPVDGTDFESDTRAMFEVDFMGTVAMTRAVLPSMKAQRSGHILNMSSVVGRKAFPHFGGYSAMMHAITGFTDALRQELRDAGIDVSVIHPALTQTPLLGDVPPADMPPPFRALSPIPAEVVAGAAVEGVRRRQKRIVVPRQPNALLFLDAISPRLGDGMVRLLENPVFGRLIGSYRGATYEHRRTAADLPS